MIDQYALRQLHLVADSVEGKRSGTTSDEAETTSLLKVLDCIVDSLMVNN